MKLPDHLLNKLKPKPAEEPQETSDRRFAAAMKQIQEVAELATRLKDANDQLERKAAELQEISDRFRRNNPLPETHRAGRDHLNPELALDEDLQKLQLAASAAGIGTWHWDLVKGELEWSGRCKELFGLSSDCTVNYPALLAAIHQEDRATLDQALRQALQEDGELCVEMRVSLADGRVRRVLKKGRVFFDQQGKPLRLQGIALDVTNTAGKRN